MNGSTINTHIHLMEGDCVTVKSVEVDSRHARPVAPILAHDHMQGLRIMGTSKSNFCIAIHGNR